MRRIETVGSVWVIDDDLGRYCRFPKSEAPRLNPKWGGPEAGLLQDAVWHDFTEAYIDWVRGRLVIEVDKGALTRLSAPMLHEDIVAHYLDLPDD